MPRPIPRAPPVTITERGAGVTAGPPHNGFSDPRAVRLVRFRASQDASGVAGTMFDVMEWNAPTGGAATRPGGTGHCRRTGARVPDSRRLGLAGQPADLGKSFGCELADSVLPVVRVEVRCLWL